MEINTHISDKEITPINVQYVIESSFCWNMQNFADRFHSNNFQITLTTRPACLKPTVHTVVGHTIDTQMIES